MSTKDDALIEKMARAAAGNVSKAQWDANPDEHWRLEGMDAALAVARPAILLEAATLADQFEIDGAWRIASAIRSLANQEQHND